MIYEDLFPIPLTKSMFPRELTESELAFVYANQEGGHSNLEGNVRSDSSNVLDDPSMIAIKKFIDQELKVYVDNILCANNIELYVTQSWFNYTNKGQKHHKHIHHNSIVSGVFYIDVIPEIDKIIFYNKNSEQSMVFDTHTYTKFNSPSWYHSVTNNQLIMFPSGMPHSVGIVHEDRTRISLAFNTFVRGELGVEQHSNQLKL